MMAKEDHQDSFLADELVRLVQSVAAAGRSILPLAPNALLGSIVEAAAKIFGAAAASIMLVNESDGVLEFKAAYGASNRDLVGTRIPLDRGIAGYVAMSGQPIAISDVSQDARFNADFAKSTGYVPRSILATPLLAGERVIGVMEVLDKINAPSFGMQDIELLGLFARQAALAIEQLQCLEDLNHAMLVNLKQLAGTDADNPSEQLLAALDKQLDTFTQDDLLKLANQLSEFTRMGAAEREMALKILAAVCEYSETRRKLSLGAGLR